MKRMSKLLALVLALAMTLALASCGGVTVGNDTGSGGGSSAATSSGNAASSGDAASSGGGAPVDASGAQEGCNVDLSGVDLSGYTIGYVTISSSAPWGGRVGTELKRMAEEAGAKVNSLDANGNADDVTNYCRQMIDAGVSALAVFGGDPTAMVDVAKECKDAGIPLFLCALDVAEEGREYATACIGPDQEQMCYDIGQRVIEQNGADAGCNVVQISGVPFLMDYQLREAGFARAMEETNYNLYEPDYAYSSRTDAKSFMEQHIQADGDSINIVMGYDDDLTMGAVSAIQEAGLGDQIKVYSLTGQNDAIKAVADGQLELTVMNRADDIAAETCVAMDQYLNDGATEYYHYTTLTFITSENVNDYIGKGEF